MCAKLSINCDRISLNKDKSRICFIFVILNFEYEYAKLMINSNYFIVILH